MACSLFGFCYFADTQLLSVCQHNNPPITVRLKELIGSKHATRKNGQRAM